MEAVPLQRGEQNVQFTAFCIEDNESDIIKILLWEVTWKLDSLEINWHNENMNLKSYSKNINSLSKQRMPSEDQPSEDQSFWGISEI